MINAGSPYPVIQFPRNNGGFFSDFLKMNARKPDATTSKTILHLSYPKPATKH